MTSLSHALIGASISAKITNPWPVLVVCLFTHFACDAIPHWDLGTNWRNRPKSVTGMLAIAETLLAVLGTYALFSHLVPSTTTLLIAIIFSLLPDWLEAPYFVLLPNPPKFFYYIYKFQSTVHEKLRAPYGVITQIGVVLAFLFVGFVI